MSGMTCGESRALQELRLDGALDASRAVELERHLGDCASCRRHAAELTRLREALRSLPDLEFPDGALAGVFDRTVGRDHSRRVPAWRSARWLLAAAVLLVALLLVPLLDVGSGGARRPHRFTEAELHEASVELQAVLGIAGRAVGRGGARGLASALREGVAPTLGSRSARAAEQVLEREVAPPLEALPLLSAAPIQRASPDEEPDAR